MFSLPHNCVLNSIVTHALILVPLPAELGSNYAELTHNFEEACAERQRLELQSLGLAGEVSELQSELTEAEMRLSVLHDRMKEMSQELEAARAQREGDEAEVRRGRWPITYATTWIEGCLRADGDFSPFL